ncbi:MAG: 3-phosphoshikimate 1-carboxyvinyltransferase [Actinomycetota bacterium]|nr:3-phosphoshikimate 1-carboxyvinyltransferase [Actinomycetota bacterium]
MSAIRITGGRPLRGRLRVPGDKSISHRALMLAARAEGTSVVRGLADGDDVARTAAAVVAMGANIDGERITGGTARLHESAGVVDVGNSGTSMRLLAGLCAGFDWLTVLTGDPSLSGRPMDRVAEPLRAMGAAIDGRDGGRLPPLVVRGGSLHGIEYTPPVASAQVKSAVLLAGLAAEGETVVHEPAPTRAHTEELLVACGADIEVGAGGRTVRVRASPLAPLRLDVPGDPSQAAFWVVAACIVPGSDVVIEGVYLGAARTGFLDVLQRMGADVTRPDEDVLRARYGPLKATDVTAEEVPGLIDEIPVLAVAASVADGVTTFAGAQELRVKESDRIATVTEALRAFGVEVEPRPDGLVVTGGGRLTAGSAQSHGDHRVAMAMAVAAMAAGGESTIEGWDAVLTSYPSFLSHLEQVA